MGPILGAGSALTVDRYFKCGADFAHPRVAQSPETIDKDRERDALDGVKIDPCSSWNRVVTRFEHDLTGQASDCRGAGSYKCASEPRDRDVTRQDHDRAPTDVRGLAPPNFTTHRYRTHDAAAASRNDARSPHSSGSSNGCSSYAAYLASTSAAR
jgi:hypothetical protein